jgi:crotonobetaine/carnitine-CoA ligase
VFGIPSEFSGEEVMAAIVLKRGAARPAHQDLIRHLEPRLARFAIPRYLEFVDELPLTDTGKIRRWDLRERGVTGATWDREHAAASP